jgi:hypothetical protein
VWDKSWVLLIVLGACDSADQPVATAAAGVSAPAAPARESRLLGERGLRALAWVNQPDLSKARPLEERHALLAKLSATADGRHVDRRLNLALDLRQAAEAPDPCATYGTALGRIEHSADAYFWAHLQAAAAPPQCADLRAERDKVLARLGGATDDAPPLEEEPAIEAPPPEEAAPSTPTTPDPSARRGRKRRTQTTGSATRPPPAPPPVTKPADPPKRTRPSIASKIDEELKPFGL